MRRAQNILCEAVTAALAAESRRCVAADLESEETCCRSEERVCGSQWPNAPISTVTSSDIIPFVSRSLKACWYISLLSFLDLAFWRQPGELYGTVSSIRMISLALTMTMSGRAEVSRISAGMVDGGLSVTLNPGRSAYSLSPGWRYSPVSYTHLTLPTTPYV